MPGTKTIPLQPRVLLWNTVPQSYMTGPMMSMSRRSQRLADLLLLSDSWSCGLGRKQHGGDV